MEATQGTVQTNTQERKSWLDYPIFSAQTLSWEVVLFGFIIFLVIGTRFFDLGTRVMSHDETSHVYFSWLFEQGSGYSHDPVTHGPLQFHLVALSYFIFGDSDFSARIPAALFSIATVAFMWNYRRFIGRTGAIIAAILLLISPYILYYGRYVRNEAFVALFGVITLWAILSYLESGASRYLYWLTAATALHFTSKETSFIYTAQALIFLAFYLLFRLTKLKWSIPEMRSHFIYAALAGILLLAIAGGTVMINRGSIEAETLDTATAAETVQQLAGTGDGLIGILSIALLAVSVIALAITIYFLIRGYTWTSLCQERSFGLLIILSTLVLPMLAPFPVNALGFNPIDYQNQTSIIITGVFVGIFAIVAIAIGLLWNPRLWLINAGIFYTIFTIFYTSVFTNGFGFFTGLVGSLGYWLEQQAVERGSQPWYYYWLVQIPIYEFLPALGSLLALIFAPYLLKEPKSETASFHDADTTGSDRSRIKSTAEGNDSTAGDENGPHGVNNQTEVIDTEKRDIKKTTIVLLGFWSISSLIAYTVAGEKMPWLTVHIAWPMIILTAWFLGRIIDTTNWSIVRTRRGILVLLLLPVFFLSTSAAMGSLLGPNPPFMGKELDNLQATSTFITALLTAIASGWGVAYLVKDWSSGQVIRMITLVVFGLLGLLTGRAAYRAAYINYDNATEYLVYAHMARGPKEALEQMEEISRRTTNGLALRIAYDNETTYPYWWYLRNYTNKDYFAENPTRAQRDAAAILVGEGNYGKIEPVVGQAYNEFEYTRIWWPNQDYYGLTIERIVDAITNPQMRAALFDIWMDRDYTLYAEFTNKDISLPNWQPSQKMRLYIRKDVIASLWNYGVSPSIEDIVADPYDGKQVSLNADLIIGAPGAEPGQLKRQRDIAVALDGSIYVADTENHRIQHLAQDGTVINVWGSFGASTETVSAPNGTFNEPWGIGLGPDGSVYIADTWNNRIQKFTSSGEFITSWGYGISQTEDPYGFYGPR
ncbi:MAG: TIGR03663 family protein, partial [Anaerolineales bacterium]